MSHDDQSHDGVSQCEYAPAAALVAPLPGRIGLTSRSARRWWAPAGSVHELATAQEPAAASELIQHLTTPAAAAVMKANGMQAPQAPALLDNVRPDFPSPAPTRRWWARRYVGICFGTSPHLAATRWHVAYWAKQTFFCYRSQMRDWLWKYQRPTVIWWQIWLKRDLKARGHFPQPLGNQFVRELTEMLMKDAAYWPGEIDWNQFRNRMRASTQMVEDVIRNQAELAKRDAMPPPHFLVMKHLGYFDGYIQRN